MTLAALVVADDLTGAMDTGHAFAERGHPTTVAVGPGARPAPPEGGVLVANTDSRYLPPEEARERVADAVEASPAAVVYKKVDSTLRGNLTAEIGAAMEATGADRALVAPAFPANGRRTACGFHLVDGALVTDTPAGRDPDRPVATPHLPTLLGAGEWSVGRIGVETAASGAGAVAEVVGEADADLLAGDAVHDDHLDALAAGADRSGLDVLYAGSAGLAGAVAAAVVPAPDERASAEAGTTAETTGGEAGAAASPREGATGVLGIAGSASPVTVAGLAALPEEWVVRLDVERAVADPAAAGRDAAARARSTLADAGTAVVTSVLGEDPVERALAAGRDRGLSPETVRRRVAEGLARTAAAVWEATAPAGLFVTGGAVAGRTFDALETSSVRLWGEAVEAGVPVGRVLDGAAAGTRVVTKAGAFGTERTIANCLARLGRSHER